jgi:hypothetical protein
MVRRNSLPIFASPDGGQDRTGWFCRLSLRALASQIRRSRASSGPRLAERAARREAHLLPWGQPVIVDKPAIRRSLSRESPFSPIGPRNGLALKPSSQHVLLPQLCDRRARALAVLLVRVSACSVIAAPLPLQTLLQAVHSARSSFAAFLRPRRLRLIRTSGASCGCALRLNGDPAARVALEVRALPFRRSVWRHCHRGCRLKTGGAARMLLFSNLLRP